MIKFFLRLLVVAAAVVVASYIVTGISVASFWTALFVALVLALLNTFVKPILSILTLPITILTLGLFGIVLNVLLFWLASWLVAGFVVVGLMAHIWGALITTVARLIAQKIF